MVHLVWRSWLSQREEIEDQRRDLLDGLLGFCDKGFWMENRSSLGVVCRKMEDRDLGLFWVASFSTVREEAPMEEIKEEATEKRSMGVVWFRRK